MSNFNTTDVEIYKTIIKLVRGSIGDDSFDVIVGNQSGREPNGSFAVIYDISSQTNGMAGSGYDADDEQAVITISQLIKRRYMIQFWRSGAHDNAFVFCSFIQSQSALDILYDTNIAVSCADTITRIDEEFGGAFMEGASVDLFVRTSSAFVETVPVIDDVDIIVGDE